MKKVKTKTTPQKSKNTPEKSKPTPEKTKNTLEKSMTQITLPSPIQSENNLRKRVKAESHSNETVPRKPTLSEEQIAATKDSSHDGKTLSKDSIAPYPIRNTGKLKRFSDTLMTHLNAVCFALALIFAVCLIIAIFHYSSKLNYELQAPSFKRNPLQTHRRSVTILTESMDCSIHIKLVAMQQQHIRTMAMQGIMCLSIVLPHIVQKDSSISMNLFMNAHREEISNHIQAGYLTLQRCDNLFSIERSDVVTRPRHCPIECLTKIRSGMSTKNTVITDSAIYGHLFLDYDKNYPIHYDDHFKRLFRRPVNDSDCSDYSLSDACESHRVRYVLTDEFTRGYNEFSKSSDAAFMTKHLDLEEHPNLRNGSSDFTGRVASLNPAHYKSIIDSFVNSSAEGFCHPLRINLDYIHMGSIIMKDEPVFPSVMIPKGAITSRLSAFVIAVVMRSYEIYPTDDVREFNRRLMLAQKASVCSLMTTRYWNPGCELDPEFNTPDLPDECLLDNIFPDLIESTADALTSGVKELEICRSKPVKRNAKRVTSMILWKQRPSDQVLLVELETGASVLNKNVDSVFVANGTKDSQPYTSAAGVTIITSKIQLTDEIRRKQFISHETPSLVVGASGTYRTLEAVTTTALRIMLFKDSAAEAVNYQGCYYSLKTGLFHSEDKKLVEDMNKYASSVKSFEVNHVEASSEGGRTAMAVKNFGDNKQFLESAIQKTINYNYATGY